MNWQLKELLRALIAALAGWLAALAA